MRRARKTPLSGNASLSEWRFPLSEGVGAFPPMSSEPADAVRLERCRAHAQWIAERAEGAVGERARALLDALNECGERRQGEEARRRFEGLARRCAQRRDTPWIGRGWVEHRAYLDIVAMGEAALPMLLERVGSEPLRWLPALEAITGQRWEGGEDTVTERVERWREWGREQGYVAGHADDEAATGE